MLANTRANIVIANTHQANCIGNGIGQTIWNLSAMIGLAVGAVYTTVIGHTTGAGDTEASEYYLYKLTRITIALSTLVNGFVPDHLFGLFGYSEGHHKDGISV